MRKLIAVLVMAGGVLLIPNLCKADGVTVTATYTDNTMHSAFSAPGKTISFSFNLPAVQDPSLDNLNIPLDVSFKGKSYMESAEVLLFGSTDGGLFDLDFTAKNHFYDFVFFGGQIFDSSNNLIPGNYPLETFEGVSSVLYKDDGEDPTGSFASGTVKVTGATSIPEPTSLLLLGMGLFGLLPAARRKLAKS